MTQKKYIATYSLDSITTSNGHVVDSIIDTVETLKEEGVPIDFLGAKQTLDADGSVVEITAQFTAPTKGTVGRLNVRGQLPACSTPVLQ